ncbi:bZIP transcription factor TRAB1 [Dichanthelium oligosanthes]|uniref:BZIP transcription factor TRAB1 n=1 Tax=Dichanthelium oligosanthes TaxID=888268 RepID=A0A1E5WFW8_9POAL|nr:bZIP transcription factor TRAB1 [Dichanthelium oligosanthes]
MEFNNGGSSSQRRPAVEEGEGAAPLARQGSVYSLTFDEFQSALGGAAAGGGCGGVGKDFGSMNMDELIRSIWTAEETQAMASASGAGAQPAPLQRQGSSLTLPRTLSAKTVDEVWHNLVRDEPPEGADGGGQQQAHRQSTLGEMTLEEFLVRAGVVRENPAPTPAPPPMLPPRPVPVAPKSSAFLGNIAGTDAAAAAAASLGFAPVGMGNLALGNGLMPPSAAGMGASAMSVQTAVNQLDSVGKGYSDLSSPTEPLPYSFQGMIRGRRNGGGVEKVVERRQRRMIKNRESAARSRARKQAYTMELEAEVQKLKELNEELEKKQVSFLNTATAGRDYGNAEERDIWSSLQIHATGTSTYNCNFRNEPPVLVFAHDDRKSCRQVPEMFKDPLGRKKRICLRRTLTGPW